MKFKNTIILIVVTIFCLSSVFAEELSWTKTLNSNITKYYIGSEIFSINQLMFVCEPYSSANVYPRPSLDCWNITAHYNYNEYKYGIGTEYMLNSLITAKLYDAYGFYYKPLNSYIMRDDWSATFKFKLIDTNIFNVDVPEITYAEIGSPATIKVLIDNTLADKLDGGFKIIKNYELIQGTSDFDYVQETFSKGKQYIELKVNSPYEGKVDVEIIPYAILDSDSGKFTIINKYSSKTQIVFMPKNSTLKISAKCVTDGECKLGYYCNKDVNICYKGEKSITQPIITYSKPNLWLVGILILLAIIIFVLLRKNNG